MGEFASEGRREFEKKLKACAERLLDRSVSISKRIKQVEAALRRVRDELDNASKRRSKRRDMPTNDNNEIMKYVLEEFGDVFYEWHTQEAERFFKLSGISERNWRILMLKEGLAGSKKWTLREIAERDDVGVSHVRVREICIATRKRFMNFCRSMFEAER